MTQLEGGRILLRFKLREIGEHNTWEIGGHNTYFLEILCKEIGIVSPYFRKESFADIWNNKAYQAFRSRLKSNTPPEICRSCTSYFKNIRI